MNNENGDKVQFKMVAISVEAHEKVRREAFMRRISMKEVVEEALREHYNWADNLGKKEKSNEEPDTNQSPSP